MTASIPSRRSTLVGRDTDVEEVSARVTTAALVTLVGPGGVGKTSLAHEVARAREAAGAEVHLVDLTTVTDPGAVSRQVADQVGLPPSDEVTPEEALVTRFGDHADRLLVIDNCEQVIYGVADLVDVLLDRCPNLAVLATSRERIDVEGELVWPVKPLATTADGDAPAPAVRLMIDRVEAMAPGALTRQSADALAELAGQLDGVPLALELAAARLATMPVDELSGQLLQHLPDLGGGRRSAGRHRSLGAVVEWSYELLDPEAQHALDQLSVFVGGFTRQAATATIGDEIGASLDRLVGASLLMIAEGPTPRYQMLEMIRAFARGRLEQRGETDEVALRHARWVATLMAQTSVRMRGPDEAAEVDRFVIESANIGSALLWARDHGETGLQGDIVFGLEDQFYRAGREVHAWIEQVVESIGDAPEAEVITLVAAYAAIRRGDLARARELVEVAQGASWTGRGLFMGTTGLVGVLAMFDGDLDRSLDTVAQWHVEIQEESPWIRALALAEGSMPYAYAGRAAEALALVERATEMANPIGNPTLLSWCAYSRAEALTATDPAAAIRAYAEAYRHAEAGKNRFLRGLASVSRASVLARHGEPGEAFEQFSAAVELFISTSAWSFLSTTLRNVTELMVRVERYSDAAVLRSALECLEGTTGVAGQDATRDQYLKAMLEDRLLSTRYHELVEEGRHLTRDEVVERTRTVIREELEARRTRAEFAAVVFTDLVNATAFMAERGDHDAREIMRRYEDLTGEHMHRHRGRRVKGTGDGVLAVFPTASDALRCVAQLLASLDEARTEGELPLLVRIGVHAGEMIDETSTWSGDDVHGTVVNLTARVVDRAGGGEVVVTDTVRQIVIGTPFRFEPLGEHDLKGIPDPIRLHRFAWRGEVDGPDTGRDRP